MEPQAAALYERALHSLWDDDPDTAISGLDRAAAVANSEEMAELIVIRKAEALIAAGRDGAEIAALPEIVLRRRSPRHVYLAAGVLMRRFAETGDFTRALFHGHLARRTAAELGEPLAQASVLNGLGVILAIQSHAAGAIAAFEEALAIIRGAAVCDERLTSLRVAVVGNLGGAKILANAYAEGVRLIESILPAIEIDRDRAEVSIDLAIGYLGLQDYQAAHAAALQGLRLAATPRHVRSANHLLAEICVQLGRHEEADRYFDAVASFYPDFRNVKQILRAVDLLSVVNWNA